MDTVDRLLEALDRFDPTLGTLRKLRNQATGMKVKRATDLILIEYLEHRTEVIFPNEDDYMELVRSNPEFKETIVRVAMPEKDPLIVGALMLYGIVLSGTSHAWGPWHRVAELVEQIEAEGKDD